MRVKIRPRFDFHDWLATSDDVPTLYVSALTFDEAKRIVLQMLPEAEIEKIYPVVAGVAAAAPRPGFR